MHSHTLSLTLSLSLSHTLSRTHSHALDHAGLPPNGRTRRTWATYVSLVAIRSGQLLSGLILSCRHTNWTALEWITLTGPPRRGRTRQTWAGRCTQTLSHTHFLSHSLSHSTTHTLPHTLTHTHTNSTTQGVLGMGGHAGPGREDAARGHQGGLCPRPRICF